MNYVDDDITFIMGLYHDRKRAQQSLTWLRDHYPDSRVIVRSDGDYSPRNLERLQPYRVEYYEEERLYPIEHGGAMIERMLELFLLQPTRFLLKLDTDTKVHRRFQFLPGQRCMFGTLQTSQSGIPSIQGGFIGFPQDVVTEIIESRILKDPRLKDPYKYRSESLYFRRMARRVNRTGLCSFDWIVGWISRELNIPLAPFSEVYCKWTRREKTKNKEGRYALTHPVYS